MKSVKLKYIFFLSRLKAALASCPEVALAVNKFLSNNPIFRGNTHFACQLGTVPQIY